MQPFPAHAFLALGGKMAGGFSPLGLPGLRFLYDHLSVAKPNADGSGTAVTANAGAVKWWGDRGPNGLNVSTSGTGVTLAVSSGDRAMAFAGGTSVLDAAWSPGAITGDYSYHILMRRTDDAQACGLTFLASGGTSFFGHPWTSGGQGIPGSTNYGSEWAGKSAKYTFISHVRSSGTVTTYVNGVPVHTVANSTSITPDSIQLSRYSTTTGSNMAIASIAFAAQAHSAAQVSAYHSWLRSQLPTLFGQSTNLLIYLSNSLGLGQFAGISTALMPKVHTGGLAPSFTHWLNASVGSKTTTMMLADYQTRILPLASATTGRTVIFLWEGTNDMAVGNLTAEASAANIFSLVQGLRAGISNSRVVVGTVIDRQSLGTAGTVSALKAAFNAAVLDSGNQATYGYSVADFTGVSEVSADNANDNATYFQDAPSGVHLTAAGYDTIKSIVGAAVEAALAA